MKVNENHPDYPEYMEKCKILSDEYKEKSDKIPIPDPYCFDNEDLLMLNKWFSAEIKKLQKEYAYLFTIPYDENSN